MAVAIANGATQFRMLCGECQEWSTLKHGGKNIKVDDLRRYLGTDDLSVVRSLKGANSTSGARCTRCHRRGGELHHWAPRAYFRDADEWPQDYLCLPCHQRWHDIMTADLPGFGGKRDGE